MPDPIPAQDSKPDPNYPAPGGNDLAGNDGMGDRPGAKEPITLDWPTMRSGISDQELRTYAERFNSFDDLVRDNVTRRKALSEPDRVKLPGPKATDDEIGRYRKATGVPDLAGGYAFKAPEGMQVSVDDNAVIDGLKPIFYKHNVPAKVFEEVVGAALAQSKGIEEKVTKEITDFHNAAIEGLRKEWGTNYDKNVNLANRASASHGGERFVEFLRTIKIEGGGMLGDHPEIVRFLANIGAKSDEAGLDLISSEGARATAQDQLNQLNRDVPPGTREYTAPDHQAKLTALYEKIYGKRSISGAAA